MHPTRQQIMDRFKQPECAAHPSIAGVLTFPFIHSWDQWPLSIELPRMKVTVHGMDYLRAGDRPGNPQAPLRFQQNFYRLWYQIEGTGILQNATRNTFGTARPGLLGIMDRGERHTYLHQKGMFEGFILDFSIQPSRETKCYWNAGIEGKCVLGEPDRFHFEYLIFDALHSISNRTDFLGVYPAARMTEIIALLFSKGLLIINEEQFPRDKAASLVAMAKDHMNAQFATMRTQDTLAARCGVDINYLNVLFRKQTGKTLYKYLTDVRMEHAKHLLEDSVLEVTDIASRVGYPNNNSFTRAFRTFVGMTPGAYRCRARVQQRHGAPAGN